MVYEKTYHEIRNHILPTIRRMSRKMQSIIIKTTEQHQKMREYKNVIDQSCLSSSLVFNITKLSRNLTQIMRKDVPSLEDQLEHIQKQIHEHTPSAKKQQQETLLLIYGTDAQITNMNEDLSEVERSIRSIHLQLMQTLDDILIPGLDLVEEYNTCLGSTGQSLIDYGIDQAIEHIDDDDDDDYLFPLKDLSSSYNHTDL